MWRTRIGDRVLKGAEWRLFAQGLSVLWDSIEDSLRGSDIYFTNVDIFDRLVPEQKLSMLATVAAALHDEDVPCLELTALSEGTFAAVFNTLREWVEWEIDCQRQGDTDADVRAFRDLVLAAAREADLEDDYVEPSSQAMDDWRCYLLALTDRVLWCARDFDEESFFLDANPEFAAYMRQEFDIPDDYFIAVAPDPRPHELEQAREVLRSLCTEMRSWEGEKGKGKRDVTHSWSYFVVFLGREGGIFWCRFIFRTRKMNF